MLDLHLHLDGSLTSEDIVALAKITKKPLPVPEKEIDKLLKVGNSCKSLSEYLEKFTLPLTYLTSEESIFYAVTSLVKRLRAQGLAYAEIRFAPQLHTGEGVSMEKIVQSATQAIAQSSSGDFFAQLILCCMRGGSEKDNLQTVLLASEYLSKGVCAVDLAGDERRYPTDNYASLFAFAREKKVPFVIHAGEASGAESVEQAIKFGAKRIGHGIRSIESEKTMSKLKERGIFLETCYSSNLQTKAVSGKGEYPIREFLRRGLFVTINTDNMSVSDTTLKGEYLALKRDFSLTDEELYGLCLNGIQGAFLDEPTRFVLSEKVCFSFTRWLNGR